MAPSTTTNSLIPPWWIAPHTMTDGPRFPSLGWTQASISLSPCLRRTRIRPSLWYREKQESSLKIQCLHYLRSHTLCLLPHSRWRRPQSEPMTPRPISGGQKSSPNGSNWHPPPKSADHLHSQTRSRDKAVRSDHLLDNLLFWFITLRIQMHCIPMVEALDNSWHAFWRVKTACYRHRTPYPKTVFDFIWISSDHLHSQTRTEMKRFVLTIRSSWWSSRGVEIFIETPRFLWCGPPVSRLRRKILLLHPWDTPSILTTSRRELPSADNLTIRCSICCCKFCGMIPFKSSKKYQ